MKPKLSTKRGPIIPVVSFPSLREHAALHAAQLVGKMKHTGQSRNMSMFPDLDKALRVHG